MRFRWLDILDLTSGPFFRVVHPNPTCMPQKGLGFRGTLSKPKQQAKPSWRRLGSKTHPRSWNKEFLGGGAKGSH